MRKKIVLVAMSLSIFICSCGSDPISTDETANQSSSISESTVEAYSEDEFNSKASELYTFLYDSSIELLNLGEREYNQWDASIKLGVSSVDFEKILSDSYSWLSENSGATKETLESDCALIKQQYNVLIDMNVSDGHIDDTLSYIKELYDSYINLYVMVSDPSGEIDAFADSYNSYLKSIKKCTGYLKETLSIPETNTSVSSEDSDTESSIETESTENVIESAPAQSPETPSVSDTFGHESGDATLEEQNALAKALSYLSHSAFSRSGLIEQLQYNEFSLEASTYAVDNCNANWTEQAVEKAKSYISHSVFSRSGLISQLEYNGFSNEDATYAADNIGADWNDQAAKKAQSYLSHSSFSRQGLIDQLEYNGFSSSEAEFGVSAVGY
ncbi:MAG: Ltp family lipoprotein [Lachnospiraceae bacterium]|nr:Ltp family lipoprotein [Lachnospiraceae bacterium]